MNNCWNRCSSCVFVLVLLLGGGLSAAYFYGLPKLDSVLADSVRRELILPPSSTVVITRGSLLDTMEGEVSRVYVESSEAKIDGLVVEDLELLAEGVTFDVVQTAVSSQAQLKEVANGRVSLRISEPALEDRWHSELSGLGLSKVDVTLDGDKASVAGLYEVLNTEVNVSATGAFIVDDAQQVKFQATEFELSGVKFGLDKFKAVFSKMPPVIDLSRFKMTVDVDKLESSDGYLYISARSRDLRDKVSEDIKRVEEEKAASETSTEQETDAEAGDGGSGTDAGDGDGSVAESTGP